MRCVAMGYLYLTCGSSEDDELSPPEAFQYAVEHRQAPGLHAQACGRSLCAGAGEERLDNVLAVMPECLQLLVREHLRLAEEQRDEPRDDMSQGIVGVLGRILSEREDTQASRADEGMVLSIPCI